MCAVRVDSFGYSTVSIDVQAELLAIEGYVTYACRLNWKLCWMNVENIHLNQYNEI